MIIQSRPDGYRDTVISIIPRLPDHRRESRLFFFLCSVKVLLLHQHFRTPYKGGAIRSYYLAKALVDRAIQTIVITAHNDKGERREDIDGIEVHYLPIPYDNRFGFYSRAFSFIRYMFGALTRARKFRDADVCYAISVPLTVGLAARMIKFRFKIPFIFEVGDLWPDAPIQMGFVKNKLFQSLLYTLEKGIYREASAMVALSPAIQKAIEGKIPGKKVHLIPNMADTDFFKAAPKEPSLEKKFNVAGKFVVSCIGAIGVANGLHYFLECAVVCEKAGLPMHFLLCGDGALLEEIRSSATRSKLKNFTILPFQNREGVREIMNVTDAAFVSYLPVQILETGSPNKYFDGLAAGKIIMVNFGGWIREEIEREKCGLFVNPYNAVDFKDKIQPLLSDKILAATFGKNARQLAEKKYSRSILSDAFHTIISRSIDKKK